MPTVDVGPFPDRVERLDHLLGFIVRQRIVLADPVLALHRQALHHRRALRQHAVEFGIMPVRREIDRAVVECVAIDEAGERGERQVGAIDRVREQYRVVRRCFDGPEIVEFDDEAVFIEGWSRGVRLRAERAAQLGQQSARRAGYRVPAVARNELVNGRQLEQPVESGNRATRGGSGIQHGGANPVSILRKKAVRIANMGGGQGETVYRKYWKVTTAG